jgi:tungstate transport system substrate-binding protein
VEGEHSLRREYHVLAVNPHRFPKVNHDDARALVEFLLSGAGQEQIRRFGTPSGRPAFFPGVGKAPADPEGSGKETR